MRTADPFTLLGEVMTEKQKDRYSIHFDAWIFDGSSPTGPTKVVAKIACSTNGRASVRWGEVDEFTPHMLDLIAKVSLAVREAASEVIDWHAAVESEVRHLKPGGSVYDVPADE